MNGRMGELEGDGVHERAERQFGALMAGASYPCPLASPARPPPWLDQEAAARGCQVPLLGGSSLGSSPPEGQSEKNIAAYSSPS